MTDSACARPHRILVIDDEGVNLELLRIQLAADNYVISCVAGGNAGLAAAHASPPDLIISDVLMPDLDGFEVVRCLKSSEALRMIPVLLVTSANGRHEMLDGLAAGADDFLSRPIDSAELRARVRSLLRSKSLSEQLQVLNRELEERVARRTTELRATISELEAFAYSISHDLRAPLRAIDGFSQALLEDYSLGLEPGAIDYLERVRGASQRMGRMIDDLLDLSRLGRETMRTTVVDMSALALDVAVELQREQPERAVTFAIQSGLQALGDPGLLRLVYQNLLENAWKFTRRKSPAEIVVGAAECDGSMAYFVRDNGAGFDMAYASKLFGVFQRLHDQSDFEGNGIGLATVQRIVHRHAGRVWAESVAHAGSTFWFTLSADDTVGNHV